jgi:hypothetical protein
MQWDTICSPVALVNDGTPEAIPYPFTDAVKYHATYLALLEAQRKDDAEGMFASNQSIIAGTATYAFNHYHRY